MRTRLRQAGRASAGPHARAGLTALLALSLLWSAPASAGGFFLPAHGVRGLGRAGAFYAGGDDPGAIWYNPASIAGLPGLQLLADASLVLLGTAYTRTDSGGNPYPTVHNEGKLLPVPTIAFSRPLSKRLWLGGSLSAPLAALPAYPRPEYRACGGPGGRNCLDSADVDAPQRYSLISFEGTVLLQADLALALQILPELSIGLSVQNLFASLFVLKALSSYNGVLSSGPEDPDFDSLSQVKAVDLFNPSARIGALYQPDPRLRVGVALQLPFALDTQSEIDVQLPASPVYDAATVEGSSARLQMMLPLTVGAGLEVRPLAGLRLEVALQWEHWSGTRTDCPSTALGGTMDQPMVAGGCEMLIQPDDIYILDIPGIPRYKIPDLAERLGFRDSISLRLGGEFFLSRLPLVLRAGYGYERGAVPPASRSVIANDPNKHVMSVGLGYTLGGYRIDAAYALIYAPDLYVHYLASEARQINPINPTSSRTVGGGHYSISTHVLGIGVNKGF